MAQEQVILRATDGPCTAYVLTPNGEGPWPGVLFYMDAFGVRPALVAMAAHLAEQGYVVLLPDLFYRYGPYGPLDPHDIRNTDVRALVARLMLSTDMQRAAGDTADYITYLAGRADVRAERLGTVGFFMGGGMALAAAALFPDRIVAAASFHGGRLATDDPLSPHLLLGTVRAEVYIAAADNDPSYPPAMAARFEAALKAAAVKYESENYEGKTHGWMTPDMPFYDAEAAERGWKALTALYERTLG